MVTLPISHVHNLVIKRFKTNQQRNETNKEEGNRKIIWIQFLYLGKKGETLLTSLKRKKKKKKKKKEKILERRCKIYHLLQYEENGNVFVR